jgi:hypothetical protein
MDYVHPVKGEGVSCPRLRDVASLPPQDISGEEDHLLYIRTSLASVKGDDPERSQTLDICMVIFSIVTYNKSTKAGRRGFTSLRALTWVTVVSLSAVPASVRRRHDLESHVFKPFGFGDTRVPSWTRISDKIYSRMISAL